MLKKIAKKKENKKPVGHPVLGGGIMSKIKEGAQKTKFEFSDAQNKL